MAKSKDEPVRLTVRDRIWLVFAGSTSAALTYGTASWGIDNGSLWLYAITLILLIITLRIFFKALTATPQKKRNQRAGSGAEDVLGLILEAAAFWV